MIYKINNNNNNKLIIDFIFSSDRISIANKVHKTIV